LLARRLVTLVPALAIIAMGVEPTTALVASQVMLSFGIPFALVPLVLLTRRHDVMGALVNRRATTVVATAVATVITGLNLTLIVLTFSG
jgi:manganese transport protein